jgi:hypothetical protein
MPNKAFISPEQIVIGQSLLKWAREFLMAEDARVKRPYGGDTVCPFVKASIDSNAFYMVFHNEINGEDPEAIVDLLLEYISPFQIHGPYRENEQVNKALLIVFPRIPAEHYWVLDSVHQLTKDKMVEAGLMINQSHPKCRTPAIHNPEWTSVSVAPYPLMAMRMMAVHDILFLGSKKQWFLRYHSRFGNRFDRPELLGVNRHLAPLYAKAKAKYLSIAKIKAETKPAQMVESHDEDPNLPAQEAPRTPQSPV